MKKLSLILAAVLIAAGSLAAQTVERTTKEYKLKGFNAIDVSGNFQVNVKQGAYSVKLDIPEELVDYIEVVVKNEELKIYYRKMPAKIKNVFGRDKRTTIVDISLPQVEDMSISGAGELIALDLESSNLDVSCSGASKVSISGEFGALDLDCSGASKGIVSGNAVKFKLDASGASSVDALELQSISASVDASGASKASVSVSERLILKATGASKIDYRSNDDTMLQVNSSGASSIKKL